MRIVKTLALSGAIVLSGALLAPATHAAAARPLALPTAATRTVHVDVDGDGQLDEVTVEQNAPHTYVINVVTAAGQDDVAQVTSTIEDDWGVEPWYGAARLDGVKGYELLLLSSGGDGLMFRVLTWRNGGLVREAAPKTLMKGSYDWYLADLSFARFGYKFTTKAGHRYVRDFELYPSGSHWKGTVVKSVWKAGAWKKVSSKKVNLTKTQAKAYDWLSGVTVIAQPL
jgi:hypothetical protein